MPYGHLLVNSNVIHILILKRNTTLMEKVTYYESFWNFIATITTSTEFNNILITFLIAQLAIYHTLTSIDKDNPNRLTRYWNFIDLPSLDSFSKHKTSYITSIGASFFLVVLFSIQFTDIVKKFSEKPKEKLEKVQKEYSIKDTHDIVKALEPQINYLVKNVKKLKDTQCTCEKYHTK